MVSALFQRYFSYTRPLSAISQVDLSNYKFFVFQVVLIYKVCKKATLNQAEPVTKQRFFGVFGQFWLALMDF